MLNSGFLLRGLLASSAIMALGVASARADDYIDKAKAYIATVTAPVTEWNGPTTGPKAQAKKLVIYVSTDQRNGGALDAVWRGLHHGAEISGECEERPRNGLR